MPVLTAASCPSIHQRYAVESNTTENAQPQTIEHQSSYSVVVVVKFHIPWAQPVAPYKLFIPRRTLVLRVASEHALDTHADTLNILDWTPTLSAEEI
jgi:hypothetical protein